MRTTYWETTARPIACLSERRCGVLRLSLPCNSSFCYSLDGLADILGKLKGWHESEDWMELQIAANCATCHQAVKDCLEPCGWRSSKQAQLSMFFTPTGRLPDHCPEDGHESENERYDWQRRSRRLGFILRLDELSSGTLQDVSGVKYMSSALEGSLSNDLRWRRTWLRRAAGREVTMFRTNTYLYGIKLN